MDLNDLRVEIARDALLTMLADFMEREFPLFIELQRFGSQFRFGIFAHHIS